jgi:hypothetical protein
MDAMRSESIQVMQDGDEDVDIGMTGGRWDINYIRSRRGGGEVQGRTNRSNNREWQLSIARKQIDNHGDRYRM